MIIFLLLWFRLLVFLKAKRKNMTWHKNKTDTSVVGQLQCSDARKMMDNYKVYAGPCFGRSECTQRGTIINSFKVLSHLCIGIILFHKGSNHAPSQNFKYGFISRTKESGGPMIAIFFLHVLHPIRQNYMRFHDIYMCVCVLPITRDVVG